MILSCRFPREGLSCTRSYYLSKVCFVSDMAYCKFKHSGSRFAVPGSCEPRSQSITRSHLRRGRRYSGSIRRPGAIWRKRPPTAPSIRQKKTHTQILLRQRGEGHTNGATTPTWWWLGYKRTRYSHNYSSCIVPRQCPNTHAARMLQQIPQTPSTRICFRHSCPRLHPHPPIQTTPSQATS
jgi:hypothetical protein